MSKIEPISPVGVGGMGDWREQGKGREKGACHDVEGEQGKKAKLEEGRDDLCTVRTSTQEATAQALA